ncbi:hypothetical protein Gorai_016990 [Gossypium raimondii]|uniref:Zinc knuckle CX2CX4HX4C domain-containing protein n=1 Tax=Gossypium raimondii TaxID=29730 RepID=A0A7J8PBH6_GOSRA|nr:hypothetical protein [Gossypium raimondii]
MIEDSGSPSNGSDSPAKASWKQMLLGKRKHNQDERLQSVEKDSDGDVEFLEGEVSKTMVDDIPTIEFSEVMVNGELQNVEYEALPTICFACEKYGYFKDQCSLPTVEKNNIYGEVSGNVVNSTFEGEGSEFSSWMVVEWKS